MVGMLAEKAEKVNPKMRFRDGKVKKTYLADNPGGGKREMTEMRLRSGKYKTGEWDFWGNGGRRVAG